MRLKMPKPWRVPPLAALKRLSYGCLRKVLVDQGHDWYDLASHGIDLDLLEGQGFMGQLRQRYSIAAEDGLATALIGRDDLDASAELTKWKARSIEDEQAIGGLRNPRQSIKRRG